MAAKRWKSIKLQHDGREIRLRDWRDFRGQYTLFRCNVEDWNEGDEQARLLSMLPEAWIKRVTKEEAKRAKSNHTVKMMLPKEYHTNVVAWTRKNVARDVKRHSLRNALLITVSGDREKTAMWRLDECDVSGRTIRLQAIPARMSCDEILEWVGEEVLKGGAQRVLEPPTHLRVEARRLRRQLRWRGAWRGSCHGPSGSRR